MMKQLTFLAILCASAASQAQQLALASQAENAPSWWTDVRVCRAEADPSTTPVLIGHVGQIGTRGARHVIRTVEVGGRLPGYLDKQTGTLVEFEREVMQVDETVGYTSEFYDTFAMPSGARLSCVDVAGR
jgi:hypothetical protein